MSSNSLYRQPAYLGSSHEPKHRLRCAIHGFIRFSDAERALIDHPLFRRLRWIRQLALTELIYPGATHTRFEHSLGVMEMATRIFDRLAAERGAQMEAIFSDVEALQNHTMAKARQVCRLAALLHDLGHCCFSHAAEEVIHQDRGHEALTIELLRSKEYLRNNLEEVFPGCADLTTHVIKRSPDSPPQIRLLRDIVSGQIDADRTDYLLRDSHHCGVDYGRFDHRRLIECLSVWQNEDTGELEMAINRDGIHSFESLIIARYQMNTQVYFHRLRRIYDRYLQEFFRCLGHGAFDTRKKILEWNDVRALKELIDNAGDASSPGHDWAKRIIDRDHHRDVYSMDEGAGHMDLKRAKRVFDSIRSRYPDVDFIGDFPDKLVKIHEIARPEDQDETRIDFPLLEDNRRSSLGERSQILNKLPSTFRVGFIFAAVADRKRRSEIRDECLKLTNDSA